MSDESCACIAVRLVTVQHMSGETSGGWECLACEARFVPAKACDFVNSNLRTQLAAAEAKVAKYEAGPVMQDFRALEARASELEKRIAAMLPVYNDMALALNNISVRMAGPSSNQTQQHEFDQVAAVFEKFSLTTPRIRMGLDPDGLEAKVYAAQGNPMGAKR